jgi:large subunit ribosomal protein L35
MPKMKSSRTLMKRIKVTGSGKIKRKHAYMGHLAPNKTRKEKHHLREAALVDKTDMPRIRDMINYKVK